MKRILVTGGAGFLGSHLVDRLLDISDAEVIVVDNFSTGAEENLSRHPRLSVFYGDVADPHSLSAAGKVDEIYHLACPASPVHYQADPVATMDTAITGTRRVLEYARRCRARVLIASTSEVYGDPLVHPQREDYWGNANPYGPRAMYDEGKRAAEALSWCFHKQHAVDVRIARIFNTYGPRMRFDDGRVVSNFVLQALRGEPITIYGNGEQTRSFCYVSDLVRGFTALMALAATDTQDPRCRVNYPVNLGNPGEFTILELARLVVEGVKAGVVPLDYRPLPPDDPTRRRPDIGRATGLLRWTPEVHLAEGLAATIADFRARLAAHVDAPHVITTVTVNMIP